MKQAQLGTAKFDSPEQWVALFHPAKAMAFRQLAGGTPAADAQGEVKGFVEAAEIECRRRDRTQQWSNARYQELNGEVQWRGRAQQTMEIARQFQQAAIEAVELLEAALHGWRLEDLHCEVDEELAVLEAHHSVLNAAVPCITTCVGQVAKDDWLNQHEEVEGVLEQIKATEERKTQLTMFVNKIKSNERKEERRKSKKTLLCNHATST